MNGTQLPGYGAIRIISKLRTCSGAQSLHLNMKQLISSFCRLLFFSEGVFVFKLSIEYVIYSLFHRTMEDQFLRSSFRNQFSSPANRTQNPQFPINDIENSQLKEEKKYYCPVA